MRRRKKFYSCAQIDLIFWLPVHSLVILDKTSAYTFLIHQVNFCSSKTDPDWLCLPAMLWPISSKVPVKTFSQSTSLFNLFKHFLSIVLWVLQPSSYFFLFFLCVHHFFFHNFSATYWSLVYILMKTMFSE